MSAKLVNLENGIKKIIQSGEIPNIINSLGNYAVKERSDGEIALIKKVSSLQQELNKSLNQNKLAIYKALKTIPGIKVYNE